MKNIITIFKRDIKGLVKNFFALAVAIGLCFLPALYAWFNIYSNWDPYGKTGSINIAVANMDEGWTDQNRVYINMGADVEEELRGKDSIGWVFVSDEEAVEGVRTGKYYAALVIEKDFTYSMYHGVVENIENPHITYYVNGKKNAVATKITDTAVGTVQKSINRQFIKATTAQIFTEANDFSSDLSDEDAVADFICKLVEVNEDLKLYDQMISDFTGGNEHMADVIVAVDEANTKGQDKIADGIQNITDGQADLAKTQVDFNDYSAELSESMKVIQDRLNSISKKIADAKLEEDAFVLAEDVLAIQKDLKSISQEMENLSDKTWMTPELQKSIEDALAMIDKMPEVDPEATKVATAEAVKSLQNSIEGYGNTVNSINQIYTNQMVPEINQLIDSMETTLVATKEMLAAIGNASGTLGNILESLNNTLDAANVTLGELQTVLRSTSDKLTTLIEELEGASTEEQMEMILNLLSGDPETLGNFFSEPVQVETNYIYEIANYGSGVAPFYTTLAIWVGMTILVSLIKVHADTEGLDHVKPYELFFGRYLLFFLLSQLQTGIIVLGNLFFFKIQCHYKLEFWIASAFASMTFSLLIYALTIAFGDIGKAAAVVIMVIQIAGSGGTYPIEALPSFFKAVYIFFPFPYAIDAMRECIGGMYQNHYGTCLLELGLFCVAALVIGLVIRIPFIKVNHFIEKRMKDTRML